MNAGPFSVQKFNVLMQQAAENRAPHLIKTTTHQHDTLYIPQAVMATGVGLQSSSAVHLM